MPKIYFRILSSTFTTSKYNRCRKNSILSKTCIKIMIWMMVLKVWMMIIMT